jgi:hypothetical protein
VTNLLRRIADAVTTWTTGMNPTDRAAWRQAQTLADVGELTARWLEGELGSQPGYSSPVDVDENDVPGLTADLAALNRAGIVTTGSQAGYDGPGYDGAHWQQRAAVSVLADEATAANLREQFADRDGVVVQDRTSVNLPWRPDRLTVTTRDGYPMTDFGTREPTADRAAASPGAADAIRNAEQLVIYDEEWGRNDRLWPALREAGTAPTDDTADDCF